MLKPTTPFLPKTCPTTFDGGAIYSDHLTAANAPLNMVARNARDWSPSALARAAWGVTPRRGGGASGTGSANSPPLQREPKTNSYENRRNKLTFYNRLRMPKNKRL